MSGVRILHLWPVRLHAGSINISREGSIREAEHTWYLFTY
jgi:hypothetical protein